MQSFFGTYCKLFCTSLILISLVMLQFPNEQQSRDFSSFNSWVKQHLAESEHADERFSTQDDFLTYLHNILNAAKSESDAVVSEDKNELPGSDKHQIIPYLYMAWAQHHNASDMAGTFGQDRVQLQLIHKHNGFWVNYYGIDATSGLNSEPLALLGENVSGSTAISLATQSLLSGKSINAP